MPLKDRSSFLTMPINKEGITMLERVLYLNEVLLEEMPEYREQASKFASDYSEQRRLLRSLMNVRPPRPITDEFIKVQDALLTQELAEKELINISKLRPTTINRHIYLWKGDITTLEVDAIVNAANSAMLGCFIPCHKCIDNAIHSASGVQLREKCNEIMVKQGREEPTGQAKITSGYNLPSKYVIHTVGPIISGELTAKDCELLKSCYKECLELAIQNNLSSIAFCCISTGEFHFPNDIAAQIAVETVSDILQKNRSEIEVIFNVFKQEDYQIYRKLLGEDS